MAWRVVISTRAQKGARKLPAAHRDTLLLFVDSLSSDGPTPAGWDARKLGGARNRYRLRLGRWRVIYEERRNELLITLVEVVPRGDAY